MSRSTFYLESMHIYRKDYEKTDFKSRIRLSKEEFLSSQSKMRFSFYFNIKL